MALLSISYSPSNAQTSVTDNLVGNTGNSWSGCYSNSAGSFWGGIFGGPCPGVRDDGYMVFSYGQYTLSQSIAINQALANAGSGLQVSGYNYSWSVKNSNINGWQPGSYDPIAYVDVNLYSNTGSLLVNDRYNYGYHIPNWVTFSGTRNYATPYAASGLGNIQLSVTAKDSGFWAGYYGPEFMNFNLSLNYSLDPCVNNPLYSPTCSGYAAAYLASLSKTSTTSVSPTSTSAGIVPDATKTDPTVTNVGGVELSTSGKVSAPDNIPQVVKDSQAPAQNSAVKKDNSAAVAAGLNAIKKNAERDQAIVNQTLSAVEANNNSVQSSAINNSLSTARESSEKTGVGTFNGLNVAMRTTNNTINSAVNEIQNNNLTNNLINNLLQPSTSLRIDQTPQEQRASTVNRNAPNNELAGGVSLDSMARTPQGFEAYMAGLVDRPFYAPREIYRGQRTVDNARAERFLNGASDALHQRMVEQQYNLGN